MGREGFDRHDRRAGETLATVTLTVMSDGGWESVAEV